MCSSISCHIVCSPPLYSSSLRWSATIVWYWSNIFYCIYFQSSSLKCTNCSFSSCSSDVGLESTVITLCTKVPTVLRPGGVTLEELREVLGEVALSDAVLSKLKDGEEAPSPGMKYRHYAPKAKVYLVKGDDKAYTDFVNSKDKNSTVALCYIKDKENINCHTIPLGEKDDYETQSHNLFSALRNADTLEGVDTVYVRCPEVSGMGMALFNRLIRAAGFEVINLE